MSDQIKQLSEKQILAAGWFIVGVLFLSVSIGLVKHLGYVESLKWPTVEGEIIKSTVKPIYFKGTAWGVTPDIQYVYLINRHAFFGSAIGNHPLQFNDEDGAAFVTREFPVGKEVTVYFKPADPSISLLKPGPTHEQQLLFQFGFVELMAALLGGLALWKAPLRIAAFLRSHLTNR